MPDKVISLGQGHSGFFLSVLIEFWTFSRKYKYQNLHRITNFMFFGKHSLSEAKLRFLERKIF